MAYDPDTWPSTFKCVGCPRTGPLPLMIVQVRKDNPEILLGAWCDESCRSFMRTPRHSVILGPQWPDGVRLPLPDS